jgi:hypothetical protein
MAKTSKPTPSADPARRQAVIYARVSSKEQEKEGFSIPAQLKLLKEYAAANGFVVAQEYLDVETAKQVGRAAFGEMVAYLKAHPAIRVMLVEKTDRLYRNLKDWVTVDELDAEMHFPKEGVVLSRESRSSEKFMHGIMGRFAKKAKRGRHDFAFSGLIACEKCGCAVVGEIKKQRYVYYHCTGYADKCQGNPASCRRKHVREEALEAQFTELLTRLRFDDEVLEWVREALHASHADERREHEEAIRRHQAEYKRLDERIHAMYVDKLDGLVDAAFFERMSNQWREEQNRCQREIERLQAADRSYMDEGVQLLELARNAQRLFAKQEPREKRRLLNFLLSNCTWEDGEVVATFHQPFDLLAETAVSAARAAADETAKSAKTEIWLGRSDSNFDVQSEKSSL